MNRIKNDNNNKDIFKKKSIWETEINIDIDYIIYIYINIIIFWRANFSPLSNM